MSQPKAFAAGLLRAGASGYAGYAASLLLERRPDLEERFGGAALHGWHVHLTQRVEELAAALAAEEPQLFVARVVWAGAAFRAREAEVADVEASLACLREVLREKLPVAAGEATEPYLEVAMEALAATPLDEDAGLDPEEPCQRLALDYLAAVLEGDTRVAIGRIDAALGNGLGVREAYSEVLVPALREVGRLWHSGRFSVAEEHLITAATERALALVASRATAGEPTERTALVAAVEGNAHDLGPRVVADFFDMDGWRALYLGADVPTPDLVGAVQRYAPDVLVLSASMSTQLETVAAVVASVREQVDPPPPILVGGQAFLEAPEVWRRLGADAYATCAEGAVAAAEALLADT